MEPIIHDLADNDLYKNSMGQAVFNQFPRAIARYRYINRAKDKRYRPGFAGELRQQLEMMSELRLTQRMFDFFTRRTPWLKPTYLQWFRNFQYKPSQVTIEQDATGELQIEIVGPWFEAIYWEVPLLSIITQLKRTDSKTGNMMEKAPGWDDKISDKASRMAAAEVNWIDFGTRRRFSTDVQDEVVRRMRTFAPHFRGTCNPYLACKYDVPAIGTYAHEFVMAMQALYGLQMSNAKAMDHWVTEFRGDLGIALMDTLTTPVFLRDFDTFYAKLFDGVRQDSGDPFDIARLVIAHYEKLRIDPSSKILVFSDSLDVDKAIALQEEFSGRIKTTMGIGTNLTNDVGYEPANHVIKLTDVDFGFGFLPLLKLSDAKGKWLGASEHITQACHVLRIAQ